jgi:PAS domain S-box-containing protein
MLRSALFNLRLRLLLLVVLALLPLWGLMIYAYLGLALSGFNLLVTGLATIWALVIIGLGAVWLLPGGSNSSPTDEARLQPYGQGELSQFAEAFDEMTASLDASTGERTGLSRSERALSALFSELPGMAYRGHNDRPRTLEFVSEGCLDLTGYTASELVGHGPVVYGQLIHADDREKIWRKIQAALKEHKPFRLSYRLTPKSGQEKWVWEQGRGVWSAEGEVQALEGFITDATERVHTYQVLERRVADRTRALSALYDVTAVASKSLDLETILNQSLERVLQVMGLELGTLHLFDETKAELYLAAWRGVTVEQLRQDRSFLPIDLTEWVFQRGEPLVLPLKGEAALLTMPASAMRMRRAYVGVPMRVRGRVLGVLTLFGREGQRFDQEEASLLDAIADQIGVAVENGLLYQQAEQLAVMEERSRLARDLHDSVTQSLYSLTLFAEVGRRAVEAGQVEEVSDHLRRLGEIAQQSLKEMRLLVYELRTSTLETEGLIGALQQRLDAVEKRAGVEARLVVEETVDLPPLVEEGLYRIAQEALNNALKHAGATVVTVRVNVSMDQADLEVSDNGSGFNPQTAAKAGGLGLISMRERAEQLGGYFSIKSQPNQGTRIIVSIPTRRSWSRPMVAISELQGES